MKIDAKKYILEIILTFVALIFFVQSTGVIIFFNIATIFTFLGLPRNVVAAMSSVINSTYQTVAEIWLVLVGAIIVGFVFREKLGNLGELLWKRFFWLNILFMGTLYGVFSILGIAIFKANDIQLANFFIFCLLTQFILAEIINKSPEGNLIYLQPVACLLLNLLGAGIAIYL